MALLPQSESQGNSEMLQPRQPTTLQGLLRFAMEATKAEDAPYNSEFQPMDEEVCVQLLCESIEYLRFYFF